MAGARLIAQHGPDTGQEFELHGRSSVIGRGLDNDIGLTDGDVSRRHALIQVQDGRHWLEDLGSTNGTYVNGQVLEGRRELHHGDIIALALTTDLLFDAGLEPEPLPAAPRTGRASQPAAVTTPAPPAAGPPQMGPPEMAPQPVAPAGADLYYEARSPRSPWRSLLLAGCLVTLLAVICVGALFFLDSYQQGRLLYCGALRPLFELVLGPLGFAPICP